MRFFKILAMAAMAVLLLSVTGEAQSKNGVIFPLTAQNGYYTTVRVLDEQGRPLSGAQVYCASSLKGTTGSSGSITFPMTSDDRYNVYVEYYDRDASGEVRGGGEITIRMR